MNLWRMIRARNGSSGPTDGTAAGESGGTGGAGPQGGVNGGSDLLGRALSGLSEDAQVLHPHPILSLIPTRALARLLVQPAVAEYPKGTVIFKAGSACDAIYLIISGRCESRVSDGSGGLSVEAVFGPGETLGERAFLNCEAHRSTVTVVTDSVLLRLPGEELRALFADDPSIAGRFAQTINAAPLRVLGEKMETLAGAGTQVRRIVTVLSLSGRIDTALVLDRLAGALQRIAGARVLLLRLASDTGAVRLADWSGARRKSGSEFSFRKEVRSLAEGIGELRLRVGAGGEQAGAIAPLLSHCGRHYRFVLVEVDSGLSGALAREAMLQADLAYVFMQASVQNLSGFGQLVEGLSVRGDCSHVAPVVLAEDEQVDADAQATLAGLGYPLHSFARGFPLRDNSSSGDHRFELHLNRLAREIARCRIGLALSSGGAKGLSHVGVIQVLEENGIEVDCIAGASMGAYVGALWAYGMDGTMLEKISREHEGRWGLLSLIDPALPPRRGFLRTSRIERRLRRTIGDVHYEGLIRPLRVVATRLETLERVVFGTGDVAQSVSASIAIPGVCVPVDLGGEDYIDGGITDPLPVDVLEEMGMERIIAVNVIPPSERLRQWRERAREAKRSQHSAGGSLGRAVETQVNYFAKGNILDTMLKAVNGAQIRVAEASATRADVVLRPLACDAMWHDFTNPAKYIGLGRESALEQLSALKALAQNHETQSQRGETAVAVASGNRAA